MEIKQCQCGAVTVDGTDTDGEVFSNSMSYETFLEEFPGVVFSNESKYSNCNHCVNHWGIDLCGCGSGELVGKCQEGFNECRNSIPAQTKGESKVYALWN